MPKDPMKHTLAITCACAVALFAACGGSLSYQMKGSDLSPGADATLSADIHKQRNLTRVKLQASNLAPAERISAGAHTYVVWARPSFREPWTRLGALNLDDDGRSGSATLTYSATRFDVLVTAEPDAKVDSPSEKHMFRQHVGAPKKG